MSAVRGRAMLAARAVWVVALSLALLLPALLTGGALALVRRGEAGRRHLYRRTTVLLTRLGATFVKAGQVLGTRRDLLPPAFCDELAVLQDAVAPLDATGTRRALREAYGVAEPEIFAELDRRPVASGSVACVYRARLRTGEQVAVKLRRPGVERLMTLDLALMRAGAALAARLPVFRDVPVAEVMAHMSGAVLGQLDFTREAANLRRLRVNLATVPRVWVPKVHEAACRPRCIVMEFIPDLDVDTARRCPPALQRRFASSGLTAIYHMLFVDGFVHCDMHPGNLYFTRRGQVVVLDAGFSVQLTEELRRLFAEFFMNMSIGRGRYCAEIVVRSGTGLRPDADVAGFLTRMADLVERSHGLPAREFSLIAFAGEMFDLQRRYGVHAAPELIFPLLSLLVIEGTVRELDPGMDFQEVAKPVLMKGLFGQRKAG
ncbi:AarF/UbiB family protein [Micromonospora sp. WMMD1128]|uniref:ABC1 kinase family protein n=1 Tax=Micromonospora sp. WMMD1128 TaxID=3015150 RepID=UPI00248AEDA1|nr:AarF/UbiB family protein [Micromonospora sp. WMMD1128]WBB75825.1 AarF/UbiB family protein [Micromonospora sp. WMMD1128]